MARNNTDEDWSRWSFNIWPVRSFIISSQLCSIPVLSKVDTRDYALAINSQHGSPVPVIGIHSNYCWQSTVTALVENVEITGISNLYVTGWSASGLQALEENTDRVVGVLTNPVSSITWNWNPDYFVWVEATAIGAGSLDFSNGWKAAGTTLPITGTPAQYYRLAYWAGDASGTNNPLMLTVNEPKSVTAVFVQIITENLDVPHQWLADQGFDLEQAEPETLIAIDHDNDGYTTGQEYILGTIPTNSASTFAVAVKDPSGFEIEFNSQTGRLYSVEYSTNLTSSGWSTLTNNISGSGEYVEVIDEENDAARFYRVKVELE